MGNKTYQVCRRCVMDTTDPDIIFDAEGICNHCKRAEKQFLMPPFSLNKEDKEKELKKNIQLIKENGIGKKYDCVIGLSGGVDSSYVAYLVLKLGLRPLAVHLDNGWNSDIAEENIRNICQKLDLDLVTVHVDWEEFKDLQLAFLKSSTPDSEIPSDHAIVSILYQYARKYRIKYIISGVNQTSESIMAQSWSEGHKDWIYIKNIYKRFGSQRKKLLSFPHMSIRKIWMYKVFHRIVWFSILDYIDYDKEEAKKIILKELNWKNYGRKHGESNYTKIFQEYILPQKFGFDKRKGHLSSLIVAGQITREEALEKLKEPLYASSDALEADLDFLVKKLGITRSEFEDIMNKEVKFYSNYPNWKNSVVGRCYRNLKFRLR